MKFAREMQAPEGTTLGRDQNFRRLPMRIQSDITSILRVSRIGKSYRRVGQGTAYSDTIFWRQVKFEPYLLEIGEEEIEKASGICLCKRKKNCSLREDFAGGTRVFALKDQQHRELAFLSQIWSNIWWVFSDRMKDCLC
jgi:hypothetical protein